MKLLKVTVSHAKTNDKLVVANPSFDSFSATTFCCPQLRCNARSHKHTFPLPRCSLSLLHAHQSKARTPQILITP